MRAASIETQCRHAAELQEFATVHENPPKAGSALVGDLSATVFSWPYRNSIPSARLARPCSAGAKKSNARVRHEFPSHVAAYNRDSSNFPQGGVGLWLPRMALLRMVITDTAFPNPALNGLPVARAKTGAEIFPRCTM